jgi:rsbT co-antagonist protein RsbR
MTTTAARPEGDGARAVRALLEDRGEQVLTTWTALQLEGSARHGLLGDERQTRARGRALLEALAEGLASGSLDVAAAPAHEPLRRLLGEVSVDGARSGASPSETATGVLSLREALTQELRAAHGGGGGGVEPTVAAAGRLVDDLALLTFETFVRGREAVISRQSQQLLELSTPVVRLWEGIVAVPLVGTLDSARAQVVMETLLQSIVDEGATVAILDITGVPTFDTLVAQHLLKTVTATRLMGAECIISGIRPQTAQTIVQLGIDLADITTRSTLADALETAIDEVAHRSGTARRR